MTSGKDYRPYLFDILEAIDRINDYTAKMDMNTFLENKMVQDAVTRRIEIIGEAVSRLPEDFKKKNPSIPWQTIKDMRNKLIHDYGYVDHELVWGVVINEIPSLENKIKKIINNQK